MSIGEHTALPNVVGEKNLISYSTLEYTMSDDLLKDTNVCFCVCFCVLGIKRAWFLRPESSSPSFINKCPHYNACACRHPMP